MRLITGKRSFFGCTGFREGCEVICEDLDGATGPIIQRSDKPTEAQLSFAQQIATATAQPLLDEVRASAKALSAWIDQARANAPPKPASEKQLQFIAGKLEESPELSPPEGWPAAISSQAASAFIERALGKAGKRAGASGKSARAPARARRSSGSRR